MKKGGFFIKLFSYITITGLMFNLVSFLENNKALSQDVLNNVFLTVSIDENSPSEVLKSGMMNNGVARIFISSTCTTTHGCGSAEIYSVYMETASLSPVFLFELKGDSGYEQPILYNETKGENIDYTFSFLSWGRATVKFASPIIVNEGETIVLRVDAKTKSNARGEAQFEISSLIPMDKDKNAYAFILDGSLGKKFSVSLQPSFYLSFDGSLSDFGGTAPDKSNGVFYENGALGQAARFDGFAEYKNNGFFTELSGTVEALVKFGQEYGSDAVLWHTNDSRFVLYYDEASDGSERRITARAGKEKARPAVYAFDQFFGKSHYLGEKNSFTKSEWHHVAMTWEGSPIGTVNLYIDGELVSTSQYKPISTPSTFRIGNNYFLNHPWGNGYVDELKIYSEALSGEDIKYSYEKYNLTSTKAQAKINHYKQWGVFNLSNGLYSEIYSSVPKNVKADKSQINGDITISWDTPGILTTGEVFYRIYGTDLWRSKPDQVFSGSHSIVLENLSPGKYEYYTVSSRDSGVFSVSDLYGFDISNGQYLNFNDISTYSGTRNIYISPLLLEDTQEEIFDELGSDLRGSEDSNSVSINNEQLNETIINEEQNRDTKEEQELKPSGSSLSVNDRIVDFVINGLDEQTVQIGAGERAAAVNSYRIAFGKLPETESEFLDVIRIAIGRLPNNRNEYAEARAFVKFKSIYLRPAKIADTKDSAAIGLMAYGLRQSAQNRNLKSESIAVKTFFSVYKYLPKSAEDWNIVQAIAYSGAKR